MKLVKEAFERTVEPEIMFDVLQAVAALPDGERDFEGHTITTIKVLSERDLSFEERSVLALAISFRLQALAGLTSDGGGRGWKYDGKEGAEYLHEELVQCACAEPLIEIDGQPAFDRDSFHKRLLANSEMRGSA